MCFEDCIYFKECEHHDPNLCKIAAPCVHFPFCDETCECEGKIWFYPTKEHPDTGYPGLPQLREVE